MRWVAAVLAAGCAGGGDGSSNDPDSGGETAPSGDVMQTPWGGVAATWDADAFRLELTGDPASYVFGMAETGCASPETCCADVEGCWFGEDCAYGDGEGHVYCHAVNGGHLTLTYGGDPTDLQTGQTAFPGPGREAGVTYYLGTSAGECWTWGHDPRLYEGDFGCEAL